MTESHVLKKILASALLNKACKKGGMYLQSMPTLKVKHKVS